jgi:serine phosphatase RsbU (regulator of sigma subunit)
MNTPFITGDSMKPARLLIIDDDEKLAHLLKDYLEPLGYTVDLEHNGNDGLLRVLHGGYEAVILDVMLPGMNGYEVLREIRKQSSVPVLMLTALGEESDRITGLEVGADDYLPKTFSATELSARLRAVLRRSFATTQQTRQLREERQDLDQAREIQRALLPREFPQLDGFEISGAWLPARSVSGDYYDVLNLEDRKIAVCIGDVAGKGTPAALLMANVQAAVKAFASDKVSPAELCGKVNAILCGNLSAGRYVTFFCGVIDGAARRLVYTCAGHNPPVLLRRDGTVVRLAVGGTVLGLFPKWEYENTEVELCDDDRLLLFTDGLTEAANSAGEEFGEERLLRISKDRSQLNAADLLKTLMDAVSDFSGGNFRDDVTLLTLRVVDRSRAVAR